MKYENFTNLITFGHTQEENVRTVYYVEDEDKYTLQSPGGLILLSTVIMRTEDYVSVEEAQKAADENRDPVPVLRIRGGGAFVGDIEREKARMEDFEAKYKDLPTTFDIS